MSPADCGAAIGNGCAKTCQVCECISRVPSTMLSMTMLIVLVYLYIIITQLYRMAEVPLDNVKQIALQVNETLHG